MCDENSIDKLNFLFLLENVTKNRAFGNNTIFLQHFFAPPYEKCNPKFGTESTNFRSNLVDSVPNRLRFVESVPNRQTFDEP